MNSYGVIEFTDGTAALLIDGIIHGNFPNQDSPQAEAVTAINKTNKDNENDNEKPSNITRDGRL